MAGPEIGARILPVLTLNGLPSTEPIRGHPERRFVRAADGSTIKAVPESLYPPVGGARLSQAAEKVGSWLCFVSGHGFSRAVRGYHHQGFSPCKPLHSQGLKPNPNRR